MFETTFGKVIVGFILLILSLFLAYLYPKLITKGVCHGIKESEKENANGEKV